MLEKIHIFISLIVGILYTVYAMMVGFEFFFWLKNVIIVMILFYILGLITRYYLRKVLTPKIDEGEQIEVTEETVEDGEKTDEAQDEQRPRKRFDFSRDEEDEIDEEN